MPMRAHRTLSALDVYKRLLTLSDELEGLADQCWSVAGDTALRAASKIVRGLASGFWLTIKPDEIQEPPSASFPDNRDRNR